MVVLVSPFKCPTHREAEDMAGDPELEAMTAIAGAIKDLDEKSAARVLRWARERYVGAAEPEPPAARGKTVGAADDYEDVVSLYAAAAPRTDPERALVVGYWYQVHEGMKDFDSQRVNTRLKHLGDGVANITEAFTRLIERKPQWVIQARKSGIQRQGRKQYRVTNAGIKRVEAMLAGNHGEGSE